MQDCVKDLITAINMYDSNNPKTIEQLRNLVCVISENDELKKDRFVSGLLYTASQKMRVFGYNMLNNYSTDPSGCSSNIETIRNNAVKNLYRSQVNPNVILDKSQKEIIDIFQEASPRRLLVSAPTSYGKTFLMREIVFLNKERYHIILLVFPTVALLQENVKTMTRFVKDNELDYQIVKTVDCKFDINKNTIFVFTPERTIQLLANYPDIHIDFFFFDEVYKIDEDYCMDNIDEKIPDSVDESRCNNFLSANRGKTFRIALYLLSKMVREYYLAGPNLNRERFGVGLQRYIKANSITVKEISFEPTLRIPVNAFGSKIVECIPKCLPSASSTAVVKLDSHVQKKVSGVVNYISSNSYGKTLIYCTTPAKAIEYASKLAENTNTETTSYSKEFQEFIEHIKHEYDYNNSVNQWSLIKVLDKGFGIHHGKLPKYIQQEILEQFNNGTFQVMFCTSTIVEGVNTDAQNIIILNASKGKSKLTPFDIKNIKGRAGRYYHCFVGRVFYMRKDLVTIEASDDLKLDFETYADKDLGTIDIDNADAEDLSENNRLIKEQRELKNNNFLLPYKIFIKNRMVQKEEQENLLQYLLNDEVFKGFRKLIMYPVSVDNFLKYNWLKKILNAFARAGLIDEKTVKKFNAVGLSYREDGFIGILKYELEKNKRCKSADQAYSNAFKTLRDIVENKIPKILSLFESIIVYAAECKECDISMFSLSKVSRFYETGVKTVVGEDLAEYGFPLDAIRRLEKKLPNTAMSGIDEGKNYYFLHQNQVNSLLDNYEQKLIAKYFDTIL